MSESHNCDDTRMELLYELILIIYIIQSMDRTVAALKKLYAGHYE